MYAVIDTESKEILGKVGSNHSMSFDDIMAFAGFTWTERNNESGWSNDNGLTFYDEATACAFAVPDAIVDDDNAIIKYYEDELE